MVRKEIVVDCRTFERIVATLISMAVLAEWIGTRSNPVHCIALWILRRAESIARDFVHEVAHNPLAGTDHSYTSDADPSGALRLAQNFRALAAILDTMIRQMRPCGPDELLTARGLPGRRAAQVVVSSNAKAHAPASLLLVPDTS